MSVFPHRFDDDALSIVRERLAATSMTQLIGLGTRRAAVLIPLCEVHGAPAVLFTKRSETVRTHKGHVSFPGGKEDTTDTSLEHTALREFEEELGVNQSEVQVLGPFHEARAITGLAVRPYVGFMGEVGDNSRFSVSEAEIETVFALTLSELTDPEKRGQERLGIRKAPVFRAGPAPVWGLTAMILERFLVDVLGAKPTT